MILDKLPTARVRGVFSDLDDTLTDHSQISAATYKSLCELHEKGFWVVLVSGRPAGWADCLMRLWPLDAMIFENGAGWMIREEKKIRTVTLASDKNLAEQQSWLKEKFHHLKTRLPQIKLATDQPYRLFDCAVDFGEEPPFLSETEIDQVLNFLVEDPRGTAKLSSIHINYWYGKHTKVTAVKELIEKVGKNKKITKEEIVFVGDSPNDEPLFEFFDLSVGVSNVAKYLSRLQHPPKYVTTRPSGAGFQEIVKILTRTA